ncbi:MAG: zinc-binding dehydrogenase [bacterium]|nr:zinc-binding dehydrogenase [bacterium]
MKAVTFDPARDVFGFKSVPEPVLEKSDVLVRVEACGLNPVDAKITLWKEEAPGMNNNWVPGLDVSGTIEATGAEVGDWKVGERVLYHGDMFRPNGGFSEYAVQRAATLIPHPDVPAVEAAATPCAGWTAWRALVDKLKLTKAHSIFIAGGAGGVGSFALQIAGNIGLSKIITTCSNKNREYVLELGATHAIDYRNKDAVKEILALTHGKGVSRGMDNVGYDTDIHVANTLAYEGEMVELVELVRPELYDDAFPKGLSFHQLSLGSGHRNGAEAEAALREAGEAFSGLIESGEIKVPVIQTISLEEVGPALVEMLNQRTVGKIVYKA